MKVAFDCDDTLVLGGEHGRAIPNHNVIDLLRWFVRNGHDVIVWSGGGIEYAENWVEKFGLEGVRVLAKAAIIVDIAVDDLGFAVRDAGLPDAESGTNLGTVVICV